MNYKIKYFSRLEKSAYAVIRFPFEVYFNDDDTNEFKAANEEFVFNTVEPDASVGDEYTGSVEFRLPSWVVEKAKNTEGEKVLKQLKPTDFVINLDLNKKEMTSESLYLILMNRIVYLIGMK